MKSASLPVTPELREATEQLLRGLAARDEARQIGQCHNAEEVMSSLREVLAVCHQKQEGYC